MNTVEAGRAVQTVAARLPERLRSGGDKRREASPEASDFHVSTLLISDGREENNGVE